MRQMSKPHEQHLLGGAATCSEGFVNCFLRVPQAVGLYCSCHAAQASKGNFQLTCYKTSSSTCRPRLYMYSDILGLVHCRMQFYINSHIILISTRCYRDHCCESKPMLSLVSLVELLSSLVEPFPSSGASASSFYSSLSLESSGHFPGQMQLLI